MSSVSTLISYQPASHRHSHAPGAGSHADRPAGEGKANEEKLAEFLSKNGQLLLPMVDLIEQCQWACDELIDVTGRAAIQAVLQLSAEQVAGGRRNKANAEAGM